MKTIDNATLGTLSGGEITKEEACGIAIGIGAALAGWAGAGLGVIWCVTTS